VTPYIGVGVGFAYRNIRREHQTTEIEVDGGGVLVGPGTDYAGSNEKHQFVPAAAAMAGLAWSLTPGTVVDLNYRLTWMGSADIETTITGAAPYTSKLKIGDTFDHQLRAGVRWNVW